MDLIEKLTGLSPDGGNGMLEAVYYLVFAFAVFTVWRVRSNRRRLRRELEEERVDQRPRPG